MSEKHSAIAGFSAALPLRPDAERVRLLLGTAFIDMSMTCGLKASLPRRRNG
jgi:hypothetical protein